jgi:hypothetical protein
MIDMVLRLDLSKNGNSIGTTSISLGWPVDVNNVGPNIYEWDIYDFSNYLMFDLFWRDWKGVFENKDWGVMWLWVLDDHDQWQNVFILWDPPTSRYDASHRSGGGAIFTAKNPAFTGASIHWTVTWASSF